MCRGAICHMRLLPAVIAIACGILLGMERPASAATLFVQLFSKTGEIRLQNREAASPIPFVFYSIKSPGGALINAASAWKSITENYDAPVGLSPGNGFVDPNGEWIELSTSTAELAEGALDLDGGMIAPQRSVSLGRIWNTTKFPDFAFSATAPDGMPIDLSAVLAIDGDYLPDGIVTSFDYQLWRQNFGSTTVLLADGNLDGTINAADYVLWRNNLGMSVPSAGIAAIAGHFLQVAASGTPLPEPSGFVGGFWAAGLTALLHGPRSARHRRSSAHALESQQSIRSLHAL